MAIHESIMSTLGNSGSMCTNNAKFCVVDSSKNLVPDDQLTIDINDSTMTTQ